VWLAVYWVPVRLRVYGYFTALKRATAFQAITHPLAQETVYLLFFVALVHVRVWVGIPRVKIFVLLKFYNFRYSGVMITANGDMYLW